MAPVFLTRFGNFERPSHPLRFTRRAGGPLEASKSRKNRMLEVQAGARKGLKLLNRMDQCVTFRMIFDGPVSCRREPSTQHRAPAVGNVEGSEKIFFLTVQEGVLRVFEVRSGRTASKGLLRDLPWVSLVFGWSPTSAVLWSPIWVRTAPSPPDILF